MATAAVFAVLAGRHHSDVGARPKEVAGRPLAGLADEPEGAVVAGEAVGQGDGEALCPATECHALVNFGQHVDVAYTEVQGVRPMIVKVLREQERLLNFSPSFGYMIDI